MADEEEMTEEAMQSKVHQALCTALGDDGDALITRWVLCVERYGVSGKATIYIAAPDMASWEIVGMAEMASELARVQFTTAVVNDMYEDADEEGDD